MQCRWGTPPLLQGKMRSEQEAIQDLPAQMRRDVVQGARAKEDVELAVQAKVQQVCLEEVNLRARLVRQGAGLVQGQGHRVKGRNLIAVSGEEDGVLSLAAGDVQQAQRPHGRAKPQHLVAHVGGLHAPIVPGRAVALLVVQDPSLLRRIAQKGVDIAMKDVGKQRQRGDVRGGIAVFPFGNGLKGDVHEVGELLLRQALLFSKGMDVFSYRVGHAPRSSPSFACL